MARMKRVEFTTPGFTTWVCPPGVTAIFVRGCGGGGAGGRGGTGVAGSTTISGAGGAGGGGAQESEQCVKVVPGRTYNIQVGAGGTGLNGDYGGSGTDSMFWDSGTSSTIGLIFIGAGGGRSGAIGALIRPFGGYPFRGFDHQGEYVTQAGRGGCGNSPANTVYNNGFPEEGSGSRFAPGGAAGANGSAGGGFWGSGGGGGGGAGVGVGGAGGDGRNGNTNLTGISGSPAPATSYGAGGGGGSGGPHTAGTAYTGGNPGAGAGGRIVLEYLE